MPNLSAFAAGGVTFANHHSVFPTVTRVNASSMVTGMNPGEHGLTGNRLVIRDFDPDKHMGALEPELSRVAKAGLPVLLAPTLGQVLARHGKEYVAIGVGTSGNAYLHNPTAEDSGGATIHPTFALPRDLHESLIDRFGPWPDEAQPNTSRLAHAMRIMTEYVLPERMPGAALIWSSEPDKSHHSAGVGSSLGDTAIKEADGQFGDLMQCLRETGRAEDTDVFVVSDHGYSTISEIVPVEALVKEAGFPSGGGPGGVIVAQNGGAVLFYTMPGDMGTAQCLAAWLMAQPWCGTVTASEVVSGIPGTLPASLVGIEGPRAPELTMSFRWESTANEAGYHGMAYSTDGKPGTGQHGSMSRHEMHNILFASGPSFRSGLKLETPSGNLDLTPTILKVLSISGHEGMHGRVLEEALVGGPDAADVEWSTELHSAEHNLGEQVYRQQIKISTVGTTSYVDEGNRVD
jgi:arylsulfatase A-like enzyme